MQPIHIDRNGTEYAVIETFNSNRRRGEWDTMEARAKNHTVCSRTLRRTGPRPVDIKRSERAAKREAKH